MAPFERTIGLRGRHSRIFPKLVFAAQQGGVLGSLVLTGIQLHY